MSKGFSYPFCSEVSIEEGRVVCAIIHALYGRAPRLQKYSSHECNVYRISFDSSLADRVIKTDRCTAAVRREQCVLRYLRSFVDSLPTIEYTQAHLSASCCDFTVMLGGNPTTPKALMHKSCLDSISLFRHIGGFIASIERVPLKDVPYLYSANEAVRFHQAVAKRTQLILSRAGLWRHEYDSLITDITSCIDRQKYVFAHNSLQVVVNCDFSYYAIDWTRAGAGLPQQDLAHFIGRLLAWEWLFDDHILIPELIAGYRAAAPMESFDEVKLQNLVKYELLRDAAWRLEYVAGDHVERLLSMILSAKELVPVA